MRDRADRTPMRHRQFAHLTAQVATCSLLLIAAMWGVGGIPADLERRLIDPGSLVPDAFPRIVKDAHGDSIRLERPPMEIGSHALSTDEFLFAMVPTERVTVVSSVADDERYSNIAGIVRAGSFGRAEDLESVAVRKPDVMLVSHIARAHYTDLLRALDIPVFRIRTIYSDFDQVISAMQATGHVVGADAAAEREIAALRKRIRDATESRRAHATPPRLLAFSNFAHTLGADSLFDQIVTDLGAVNVAAEQGVGPYGSITSEQVAAWNPDWIVAGVETGQGEVTKKRLLEDPGVAVTHAGRNEQVVVIDNRIFLSMSQHAVGVMETIATALYPEAD